MGRLWAWLTRRERVDGGEQAAVDVERVGSYGETPAPAPPFPDPSPTPDPSPPTPHPQPSPPTPPQPEPVPEPPSPGPEAPPSPTGEDGPDPRAEELRAKLDEAKAAGSDRDDFESGETPIDVAEPVLDLESRRRSVHDEARSAIEEMRGGPGDSAA